jgi:hypothetical protein
MRLLQKAAVVLVAAGSLGLAATAPAMADDTATQAVPVESLPGADNGDIGLFAVAPSCVKLNQGRNGNTAWAEATNQCGYTVRFRMIWAWAGDGACSSNTYRYETRGAASIPPRPYVDELRLC